MSLTLQGIIDQGFKETTSGTTGYETYLVTSDTPLTDLSFALSVIGLPALEASWSIAYPNVKVVSRIPLYADREDAMDLYVFHVKVSYATPDPDDTGPENQDPTDRSWRRMLPGLVRPRPGRACS